MNEAPLRDQTRQKFWRRVFMVYAAGLTIATHWPRLELPPVVGPDKIVHLAAFGLGTILLGMTGWIRSLVVVMLVAAGWAMVDEWGQAIPVIHRHFSWLDMGANVVGVILATTGLGMFRQIRANHKGIG